MVVVMVGEKLIVNYCFFSKKLRRDLVLPYPCLSLFKKYLCIYLFIWLHKVLVAARGLLSCGMRTRHACGI